MGGWSTFGGAFTAILVAAAAAYMLYVVLWAISIPIFRFTGPKWSIRPTPALRQILRSWLYLGPVVLLNLVVIFGLFLAQYFFIHDVFEKSADPRGRLRDAAVTIARDKGPETVKRIADAGKQDPEAAATRALENFNRFVASPWYGAADWMSRRLLDLHRGIDLLVMAVLLAILLRDLAWTSWAVALFPVESQRRGVSRRQTIKGIVARILQVVLFTLGSAIFFAACAIGMWLATTVLFRLAIHLAETFFVEILVASISGPVAPFVAFLLLAGFYAFLLELTVLVGVVTALFVAASRRSIRLHAGRIAGRMMGVPAPENEPPALMVVVWWTGRIVLKVVGASLIVGLPLASGLLPLLGFTFGSLLSFTLQVVALNALLAWWRIDLDFRVLASELRGSLRMPRAAPAGILAVAAVESAA